MGQRSFNDITRARATATQGANILVMAKDAQSVQKDQNSRILQVRYLTTPSMRELLPMWGRAFGFMPLTPAEWQALENRCGHCAHHLVDYSPAAAYPVLRHLR